MITMILDATAGNRTMWKHKNTESIIYIDMQRKLTLKPTILTLNTLTPFRDRQFDTIFYDPPHMYGSKEGYQPAYWSKKKKYAQEHVPFAFTYYGWDAYQTWGQLLRHIHDAQMEFTRILKDDGLLFLKWCELVKSIDRVLTIFDKWTELMRLYVKSPTHTASTKQTFWIIMQKKKVDYKQSRLSQFQLTQHNTHVGLKISQSNSSQT